MGVGWDTYDSCRFGIHHEQFWAVEKSDGLLAGLRFAEVFVVAVWKVLVT